MVSPSTSLRLLRYWHFISANKGKIIGALVLLVIIIAIAIAFSIYGVPKTLNRFSRSIKCEEKAEALNRAERNTQDNVDESSTDGSSTNCSCTTESISDYYYYYDYDESGFPQNKTTRPDKLKNIVCYHGSWAVYRRKEGKFSVDMIDPYMCTHIIYSFVGLSKNYELEPIDAWNDLSEPSGIGSLKKLKNLKLKNPKLKTLIAIGGWNQGSANYSIMASNIRTRTNFIKSVLTFLEKHNLDGLDIDWEYPASRGGKSYDRHNFVHLLRSLKKAFKVKRYMLTIAVASGKEIIDAAYDVPKIDKYVDFINLMTYDYHGQWDNKTGLNAPLYRSEQDLFTNNVNWTVEYWIRKGMPAEKIMLGLGLYGHSFTLDDKSQNGLGAPAKVPGKAGRFTKENGTLSYFEICSMMKEQNGKWTVVRESKDDAPYAYSGDQWIGYDDETSIEAKVRFARSMGLGGVMVWALEHDDSRGHCHGKKYPLMSTIISIVGNKSSTRADNNQSGDDLGKEVDLAASSSLSSEIRAFDSTSPSSVTVRPQVPSSTNDPIIRLLEPTGEVPICGKRGQWWFPGPSCRQYFDCTSGTAQLKLCEENKVWRQSKRHCDNIPDPGIIC